jgi:SAM-dependent methyltransferase
VGLISTTSALSRQFAKLCDLPDFEDAELVAMMAEITPDRSPAEAHRKAWEFAMGGLFLRDVGRLDGSAHILDLGAGHEEILYWLTNRAERVVAVDIYGRGAFGGREAVASMLEDPTVHAPYPYREDHLAVLDMDARRLDFPDESFDAVVSFSSIEHFGTHEDIKRSAREVARVLKPGGHAFLVTEVFHRQHPVDHAPVLFAIRLVTLGRRCRSATPRRRSIGDVFTKRELDRMIVEPSGLRLMQPLDFSLSREALRNIQRPQPDGSVISSTGDPYPHIVLLAHNSTFTSVCLPLVKAA